MERISRYQRSTWRKAKDGIFRSMMILCAALTCVALAFLIIFIFIKGMPSINWTFLSSARSYTKGTMGILPNILNTLYIIFISLLFSVPLGIACAIYLNEYAVNQMIARSIGFALELLTGIPSIIFGLTGMFFFTMILGLKQGTLAGSLTLVLMILPTIIANTLEALKRVPDSYREGALALGSGKWHMIRSVVLPNSVRGIVSGCILASGRIIGESAALLFTAGFGIQLLGPIASLQSSSATLTVALYLYANEEGLFDVSFAIAVVLIVISVIINVLFDMFTKRMAKKENC